MATDVPDIDTEIRTQLDTESVPAGVLVTDQNVKGVGTAFSQQMLTQGLAMNTPNIDPEKGPNLKSPN